jgi:general secretion pathway protein F
MPLFRYKAVAPGGAVSVGELDAANEGEILDRLRDQGLMPMQVAPAQAGAVAAPARGEARAPRRSLFAKKRFSGEQLMAFTRELATLLRAGLPLDRALETLIGPHVDALRRDVPAGHPRRGARGQGDVAGARRATRGVQPLLRQHRARGRGGRRARDRAHASSPTRWSATRISARPSRAR